jgi:hypothetical protein
MTHCARVELCFIFRTIQTPTGAAPFGNTPLPTAISAATQGKRPPRPTHPTFSEILWTLAQRCWDQEPHLYAQKTKKSCTFFSPCQFFPFIPATMGLLI